MTTKPDDLQRLLAEEPFVLSLAHSLVADEADDVVQQAFLQALQHRPSDLHGADRGRRSGNFMAGPIVSLGGTRRGPVAQLQTAPHVRCERHAGDVWALTDSS